MKLLGGEMWDKYQCGEMIVVTTNGCLDKWGNLVMGKGAAFDMLQRFPDIKTIWGEAIRKNFISYQNKVYTYGFLAHPLIDTETDTTHRLGVFQSKYHYRNQSDINLIITSASMLQDFALDHPLLKINLNFPGIGYGRLRIENVWKHIDFLPDNVTLWVR